jgi:hypothetical protein
VEHVATLFLGEKQEGSSSGASFSLPVAVASVGAAPVQPTEEPVDEFATSPEDETEYWADNETLDDFIHNPTGSRMEFDDVSSVVGGVLRTCVIM